IPEDTVYDITKAIYENTDDIAHDKADAISKDSALDGLGDLELHPGAEKHYEEEGIEAESIYWLYGGRGRWSKQRPVFFCKTAIKTMKYKSYSGVNQCEIQ